MSNPTEPLAYQNGEYVAADRLSIPATDSGFVMGITVAEQLRTFAGQLFRLEAHLQRLSRSLEIVQIDPGMSMQELAEVARHLVGHNHRLLAAGDDLGLSVFVTPGPYATFSPRADCQPLVCLHTYPIPFSLWAHTYSTGQRVVITDVEQVSPSSWPAELKCRSRMHYYLADRKAQAVDPEARALLLSGDGHLCESSTANVVAYFEDEGLVSPPREKILPGISIGVLSELADQLRIPFFYREIRPKELITADEVLLTSTSPCLVPVVRVDGETIGEGVPGKVFRKLMSAWSEMVMLDIMDQATRFADR